MRRVIVALVIVCGLIVQRSQAVGARLVDIADGDTAGLIAAIVAANNSPGAEMISLAPGGHYILATPNDADNGLPPIVDALTITGNGATITRSRDDGTPDFRIAQVSGAGPVTFSGVTLENGRHSIGAGILNFASVALIGSTLSGNSASLYGGGIYNWPGSSLVVLNSTVSDNSADAFTPEGCHSCSYGGGINNWGWLTVTNSTIARNATGFAGGGIYTNGSVLLTNTTIVDNSSINNASGMASDSGGHITMVNTIVARSLKQTNCSAIGAPIQSLGHNLSDDPTCDSYLNQPTDLKNTPSGLDPASAQDNGGPTDTVALVVGSAAIDAGDDAVCGLPPVGSLDQRGVARPAGPHCDIGAFEFPSAPTDTEPPTVTCQSPDGLWHSNDVSLSCTASDAGSGLLNATDASFALATSVTSGTETANAATTARTVCDNANNCAAAGPFAGIRVDKRGPMISIAAPTDAVYVLNQVVVASYACLDGGSGIAGCSGSSANGASIDTGSLGNKTFSVTAADAAGNISVPRSVSYSVIASTHPTAAWIGLKNSDDVGTKFDLKVELLKNTMVVGTGQLGTVPGGSSGFNNAVLRLIGATLSDAPTYDSGDVIGVRLSVRIAEGVPGHRSGTARLWYGDESANSRVETVINGVAQTYYLRSGFGLATSAGSTRSTIDVTVDRAVNGNVFKPFGTWTIGAAVPAIAYLDHSHLYTASEDGSNPQLVFGDGVVLNSSLAWSPDGSLIAFLVNGSEHAFHVIRPNGTGHRIVPITGVSMDGGLVARLSWSPDGSRIAFNATATGSRGDEVFVINVDGTGERQLTHGGANPFGGAEPAWVTAMDPLWSPVDDTIIFQAQLDSQGTIGGYSIHADGSESPVQLVWGTRRYDWAPDGSRIAWSHGALFSMLPDGTDSRLLAPWPAFGGHSWSPDGTHIAFVHYNPDGPGPTAVSVMKADGTERRLLATGNIQEMAPGWSADGTAVFFSRFAGVFFVTRIQIDGTHATTLVPGSEVKVRR